MCLWRELGHGQCRELWMHERALSPGEPPALCLELMLYAALPDPEDLQRVTPPARQSSSHV